MRITPRAHEIERVVDLLETPDFESAALLARALIKEIAHLLQMRDLFVMTHTWANGSKGLNMGPFGSIAEAETFARKVSFGGTGRIIPITSAGIILANHDGKTGWPGYCYDPDCGHPPFDHSSIAAARGACMRIDCSCAKFVKDKPKVQKQKGD